MPHFCCVVNCSSRAERDKVSFYRFPAILTNKGEHLNALSEVRRNAWIKALKRGPLRESMLKHGRICSKHFITGKPAALDDNTNPDWLPSQNLGYISTNLPSTSASSRFERSLKRARIETEVQTEEQFEQAVDENAEIPQENPPQYDETHEEISAAKVHGNCVSVSAQTELSEDYLNRLFMDLNFCNSKIYTLQKKLDIIDLSEECFKNDDIKTLYFTGFPKAGMLFLIYECVSSYLSSHPNKTLSTFQQLLLTLMKLRLNLPFKYLSYRFAVSPTTASETFYKTLDVLYDRFKQVVYWPEREALQKNVPACFREAFGNRVAVIIDCFEVFIETPSNVVSASRCWSNYKHHETVKFLIGITPHGTISYISEAWGGRTSDKFLTENCGFLNLLLPGDIVLADRGFLIQDSVEILGAKLKIPAFTRGKTQLHPTDLEDTRNIATVRIHVERVIGLLKQKYKVFHEIIPISMLSKKLNCLTALDKMVVVGSAFISMCPSQIPSN